MILMPSVNPLAAKWKFCGEVGGSGGEKCPVEGSRQLQESRDISYLSSYFNTLNNVLTALVSGLILLPVFSIHLLEGLGAGNAHVRPSLAFFAF